MDFIEHDQAVLVLPEEEGWLHNPVPVLPSFQVEVDRCRTLVGYGARQRRLSNLARGPIMATAANSAKECSIRGVTARGIILA